MAESSDPTKYRTLREEDSYRKLKELLGDVERLDEVLDGVLWSIATNAEGWPIVPGFDTVRLAKTDGYGDTPQLKVWFQILSDNEASLLGIELDLPDGESEES